MFFAALMTALEFAVTFSVRIPLPVASGAYLNPGDSVIYLGTFFLGGIPAVIASGLGSAFSDLLAGAGAYVLPTFIIKGLMSLICGIIYKKNRGIKNFLLGQRSCRFSNGRRVLYRRKLYVWGFRGCNFPSRQFCTADIWRGDLCACVFCFEESA